LNRKQSRAVTELSAAINPDEEKEDISAGTVRDLWNAIIHEPNRKKRMKLINDFTARHSDAADFLAQNENLINAEAEMALISAAVGGTHIEREVSYRGGRKSLKAKRVTAPPNVTALNMLLKNRMPDKYSDKPMGEIEIEDVSEIMEEIENAEDDSEDEDG
jgi:hypothetical protein